MKVVAVAPLLILLLVACRDGSAGSAPSRSTPTSPDDVYSYCFEDGKAAGDRLEQNGWGPSPEYTRFTNLLDSLSGSLLPASDISAADWFQEEYQSLTGNPAAANAESRAAFERASKECSSRYGVDAATPAGALEPPPETRQKTVCVAKAAHDAESQFGAESLAYTPAYVAFAYDQTDEENPRTYLQTEADYVQATNQSPFAQPAAIVAFRERASTC